MNSISQETRGETAENTENIELRDYRDELVEVFSDELELDKDLLLLKEDDESDTIQENHFVLVEDKDEDREDWIFLIPPLVTGGEVLKFKNTEITSITRDSPLGSGLYGKGVGDKITYQIDRYKPKKFVILDFF